MPRTIFDRAWKAFLNLPGVDVDAARQNTVEDLVFAAQHEIDLYEENDSSLTAREIKAIKRFVSKYQEVR